MSSINAIIKAVIANRHFLANAWQHKFTPGSSNEHLGTGLDSSSIIMAINKNPHFLGDAWDLKLTPGSSPGPFIDTIKAVNENHHFLGESGISN